MKTINRHICTPCHVSFNNESGICPSCEQDTNNENAIKEIKITEDQLEDLGRIADMADSFHAASGMQLPASMHIDCLKTGMAMISEQIKAIYVSASGANPWQNP